VTPRSRTLSIPARQFNFRGRIAGMTDTKPSTLAATGTGGGHSRIDSRLAVILLIGAFLLGWLPRLFWGFWTDEAGTYWMAIEGWHGAIQRTANWAGQSILYSILESFFAIKGPWQEPLLRVPSVAAIVVAAWQLKRITELIVHRSAGWLAVLPFVCVPDIAGFGTSARPYALALAASLGSFRYLLEWQEMGGQQAGRWRILSKYLAASVLTLHLHYLFGFIFVIQGFYLAFCRLRGRRIGLALPLGALLVIPVSLLPVLHSLRVTAKTTGDFAHATKPAVLQLFQICFPPVPMLGAGLGVVMLLATARHLKWRSVPVRPEYAFMVFTWLTLAPVSFFLVARFTENSIFAARYLLFTLPAAILVIAWAAAGLERQEWRLTILVALFAASILHPGMLMTVFRESAASWRPPLEHISRSSSNRPAPLFVASGMANSSGLDWKEYDPATSSLYAPLTAYPITNRTIPLPYQFSAEVRDFIRVKLQKELSKEPRLLLLAASDSELAPWMSGYLQQLGYQTETHNFNDFVVVEFRRPLSGIFERSDSALSPPGYR
jgi:hypothetical protein